MDCQFTEKVSLLIDGELESEAAMRVNEHLAICSICQEAHEDFWRFRRELKIYEPRIGLLTQSRALRDVLGSTGRPFWKRRVAVPAPVFALVLLTLLSLSIWLAWMRVARPPSIAGNENRKPPIAPATVGATPSGLDLASFDHGKRAVIYKARQTKAGQIEQ